MNVGKQTSFPPEPPFYSTIFQETSPHPRTESLILFPSDPVPVFKLVSPLLSKASLVVDSSSLSQHSS